MIGRLGFGEVRVVDEAATRVDYVDGGFVQVADNCVTILTARTMAATEVDLEAMAAQLAALRARPAHGQQQMAIRDRQIARVRSQVRTARRAR
jgi:F-type H+-transporting ATPase subunit epsilon